jgi:hypothetical protein
MMLEVRTTVTLDDDVVELLHQLMRERDVTFKQAVNDALRAGLQSAENHEGVQLPVSDMGVPSVPLDHALQLAGALEDEEILRKMALGR